MMHEPRIVVDLERHFWRIQAANGETLCHSETYASRWNTNRTARKLARITGWLIVSADNQRRWTR